jgi:hypothetical protein
VAAEAAGFDPANGKMIAWISVFRKSMHAEPRWLSATYHFGSSLTSVILS